jgi:YggT family protein
MFVLANLVSAVAYLLSIVINVIMWVIIIRALVSWVNPDPGNQIVQMLYSFSEPFLTPIRKIFPFALRFGLDLSPFIAVLVLIFLDRFLVRSLFDLAMRLR